MIDIFILDRFLSDCTVHYIGQETTTRSGRGLSSVANEAVGAMSLPNSNANSTIEVQVRSKGSCFINQI